MKYVYIVHLTRRRIVALAGGMLLFIGTTLWSALYIQDSSDHSNMQVVTQNPFKYPPKINVIQPSPEHFTPAKKQNNDVLIDVLTPLNRQSIPVTKKWKALAIKKDPIAQFTKIQPKQNIKAPKVKKRLFFTIQIASFKHETEALRLQKQLVQKNFDARVEQGVRFFHVRIGIGDNKKSLEALNKRIRKHTNLESFVLQVKTNLKTS